MHKKTSTKKTRKRNSPKKQNPNAEKTAQSVDFNLYIDEFGRIQNPQRDEMIAELNKKEPPKADA